GKIISTINAILPARLYLRALLRDKNLALKMHGWNGSVTLLNKSLAQLNWWIIKLPECNGKSLIPENLTNILYTDASNTGWKASLEGGMTIHGHWNLHERSLHINHLEMKAIYFTLRAFREISNQTILVQTDNTTCVAYINHQGGTTSTI